MITEIHLWVDDDTAIGPVADYIEKVTAGVSVADNGYGNRYVIFTNPATSPGVPRLIEALIDAVRSHDPNYRPANADIAVEQPPPAADGETLAGYYRQGIK